MKTMSTASYSKRLSSVAVIIIFRKSAIETGIVFVNIVLIGLAVFVIGIVMIIMGVRNSRISITTFQLDHFILNLCDVSISKVQYFDNFYKFS